MVLNVYNIFSTYLFSIPLENVPADIETSEVIKHAIVK
jgi:hypothetical protein